MYFCVTDEEVRRFITVVRFLLAFKMFEFGARAPDTFVYVKDKIAVDKADFAEAEVEVNNRRPVEFNFIEVIG